jgi:Uma2 family endonuclease
MFRAVSISHLLTAEQLERISIPGKVVELLRGRLIVHEPPGTYHGAIAAKLAYYLGDFAQRHSSGTVFAQDTGFKVGSNPDTVRAPDVAYVRRERTEQIQRRGYAALAPDLLAEVLSPDDRPGEVLEKAANWLAAGTRIVWVIDPERCEARVYRQDGSLAIVGNDDALEGEDVLPGFSRLLGDVLQQ